MVTDDRLDKIEARLKVLEDTVLESIRHIAKSQMSIFRLTTNTKEQNEAIWNQSKDLVFEYVVGFALMFEDSPYIRWRETFAVLMKEFNITPEEIESEVQRRRAKT